MVREHPDTLVSAGIPTDDEQRVLDDEWASSAIVDNLRGIALDRTVFISSPSPYFDRMGIDEVELSTEAGNIDQLVRTVR
jgi:hypothetical protein